MKERGHLIEWIRGEVTGPSRPVSDPTTVQFGGKLFSDPVAKRTGPLSWRPHDEEESHEILYYGGESPHRKYGSGLLHPVASEQGLTGDQVALEQADRLGIDPDDSGAENPEDAVTPSKEDAEGSAEVDDQTAISTEPTDDFEVTSPDIRHPSTLGISFCVSLQPDGRLVVRLPRQRRFTWQPPDTRAVQLNGYYEACERQYIDEAGQTRKVGIWRRLSAVPPEAFVSIERSELVAGRVLRKPVPQRSGCSIRLVIEVFPRRLSPEGDRWLLTVVLCNKTPAQSGSSSREGILYQSFFEVEVAGGRLEKYPESQRPFEDLDPDEQSLSLLYRESATWGIGHGCAAGWEAEPDRQPDTIYADVMPAVELPSMTPNINVDGKPVSLSMRALANLPESGTGAAWESLDELASGYKTWIGLRRDEAARLSAPLAQVASRHLDACNRCLARINAGISLLRRDATTRRAFSLANLAMLLQQIATKQLERRSVVWSPARRALVPAGLYVSPWDMFSNGLEDLSRIGSWRAFQIAFLVMSLEGMNGRSLEDRETVDLIWFPTGGGKTEAYLGVAAFYMFHQRLLDASGRAGLASDGTNVLMRYTLRMLTTQQFQRAASLICAMEFLRANPDKHDHGPIPGTRFSLGLWIGGDASPNSKQDARAQVSAYRRGFADGNPLVLTECPWCRCEIGRSDDANKPAGLRENEWHQKCIVGISDDRTEGPRLLCPDSGCAFGGEFDHLPVEVIDERIYEYPPSLVIATADKFAIVAYRPEAGALFGRLTRGGERQQVRIPPGLIIQDELHLISGPLGTMYALYEGVIEQLCSYGTGDLQTKPKIIASTATIRGADEQVKAVYARVDTRTHSVKVQLFPSPGLSMGDSFFGRYSRDGAGVLHPGRLYLGIHASDYGSVLTTQVRTFAAALFRPWLFDETHRDPWWTLLAFYNSIRELGGAKTLFASDIRSRLKFVFNREGVGKARRTLRSVEELTSRLSQAGIVQMMDQLNLPYKPRDNKRVVDACLASNIIEVGVDIERLSLMSVVGQPKSTATYIQVTGRVGRKWWERPGLILTVYNPSKSRDRSHFEQFHSYHRRLYERVEPTTATPFAVATIQRALAGVLIAWARQHSNAAVGDPTAYASAVKTAYELLCERCRSTQVPEDQTRSLEELERVRDILMQRWSLNPQRWWEFPQRKDGEYLMLWPGQYATGLQLARGIVVPSSMRQVDRSAELAITSAYLTAQLAGGP